MESGQRSKYFESNKLYKDNGFLDKKDAQEFIKYLEDLYNNETIVVSSSKRQEKKNPPLLYNLAELQNECSKRFKLSPDETLKLSRTYMKRNWLHTQEPMPESYQIAVTKRFIKISGFK